MAREAVRDVSEPRLQRVKPGLRAGDALARFLPAALALGLVERRDGTALDLRGEFRIELRRLRAELERLPLLVHNSHELAAHLRGEAQQFVSRVA